MLCWQLCPEQEIMLFPSLIRAQHSNRYSGLILELAEDPEPEA